MLPGHARVLTGDQTLDLREVAQPALKRFGRTEVVRVTLVLYNTVADIDAVAQSLWRLTAGR
jgi:selenocysteine lyase/cysteine desulfurase